jgi:hypothetical protein
MWIILAAVLVVCWLLGLVLFHVTGFVIHILLVIAVIAVVMHFIRGRKSAP